MKQNDDNNTALVMSAQPLSSISKIPSQAFRFVEGRYAKKMSFGHERLK